MRNKVVRTLHYNPATEFWYTSNGTLNVCGAWLGHQYILDEDRPVRMVFSKDTDAEDANLVGRPIHGGLRHTVQVPGEGPRPTGMTSELRFLLHGLQKRWNQDTIAVWFEQDWEE